MVHSRELLLTLPSPLALLVLLLCLRAQLAKVALAQCPQWVNDQIQQCVQPVAEFAKTLNREQEKEAESARPTALKTAELGSALQWPTQMGASVFRELCRLINDFEMCVDSYRAQCRRHITISLIQASYGFLCSEGYHTFMDSAECLMELDRRPAVKGCHDRTLEDIELANNERNGTIATKLEKMCNALNFFSECVRTPIRERCGVAAWRVIFRVLKDTTRTLMPRCHFEEEDEGEDEDGRQRQEDKAPKMEKQQLEESNRENDQRQRESITIGSEREAEGDTRAAQTLAAGWERWEEEAGMAEDREEGEEEKEGAKAQASHQIHYGTHNQQQQGSGASRRTPDSQTLLPLALLSLFPYSLSYIIGRFVGHRIFQQYFE